MDLGLLLLRLVVGGVMAAHGAQKLFGWFGGYGIQGTGGWLESLGFKPGRRQALIVGCAEFGAGILLALGLFTPFAAAAIIGVMVVAIAAVHRANGFFNTAGGYEFNLVLIAAATAIAFAGAGAASFDNALGLGFFEGAFWGFVAVVLGSLTGAVVASTRDQEPAAEDEADEEAEETQVIDLREEEETRV